MTQKYSLLLIDDEAANLQKLQRTFMDRYDVHPARSGEEALQILRPLPVKRSWRSWKNTISSWSSPTSGCPT